MNLPRLGRLLRTLRHLRIRQIRAQALHVFSGGVQPVPWTAPPPRPVVAEVEAPFLPSPPHARFDGWNGVELIGRSVRFRESIDWDISSEGPLWAFHLHQFDYLRSSALSSDARWRLMRDWILHCHGGAGWSQHPTCLRLLSWGKLMLTPGALKLDSSAQELLLGSMASQTETLARNLEVRLQANHLLSNLMGVVWAGLLFEGADADRWLAHEAALRGELDEQILCDGAHIERSPMYHALLFENVLDLLNLARASKRTPPALLQQLEDAAVRMWVAHRVWRHPDGEIALFGDSAFEIAHPPVVLDGYATSLGIERREPERKGVLEAAGVARLERGSFTLIVTASAPMPAYQPGHAHCDALSFELSVKDERVVTDTGVTEYIPGPLRDESRATASHATLEVEGNEQSEVWAAHRVGGRSEVQIDRVVPDEEFVASCAGWATPRVSHERQFRVVGGSIEIEDRLRGGPARVRMTLPLAPGLTPRLHSRTRAVGAEGEAGDEGERGGAPRGATYGGEVLIDLDCGLELRIELPAGVDWRLESSAYFPRFGSIEERACLVGCADAFEHGHWRFSLRRPQRGREDQRRSRSRHPRGRG